MMDNGSLNTFLTIRKQAGARDAFGQTLTQWVIHGYEWANVRFESGSETIKSGAPTSIAKCSIRTHYRSDVTAGMRFEDEAGTIYRITAVLPHGRRENVDYVCEVVT